MVYKGKPTKIDDLGVPPFMETSIYVRNMNIMMEIRTNIRMMIRIMRKRAYPSRNMSLG